MPKVNLPELDALAEYVSGKVPRLGMFSTLKGLIENSPKDQATAQEWAGYLKPGQIATRAGVEFPLKKEELEYSKIPQWLSGYKPNEMISRDQVLGQYMAEAPNLNAMVRSQEAKAGNLREQQVDRPPDSLTVGDPLHGQYSHAERGSSPDNSSSPYGHQFYQEDITTSPDFGEFSSHFTPQDISWNRTNRLPVGGQDLVGAEDLSDPGVKLMRVIDEIQSDRHQKAIKPGGWNPTPENLSRMQDLANDIMQNPPRQEGDPVLPILRSRMLDILRYGPEGSNFPEVANDPRWKELQQLRENSRGKVGYQSPEASARVQAIEQMPEYQRPSEMLAQSHRITFNDEGQPVTGPDRDLQARIQALRAEHDRLNKGVPDTPFKTTQGFVGLEMRKALNDALHSGDQSLALATGDDQNAFYGRKFSEDQTSGQNYAYNTSYPSVLKDLARKYGFDYKPTSATLAVKGPTQNPNWPPQNFNHVFGREAAGSADLHDYFDVLNEGLRTGAYDEHDVATRHNRLWDEMTERLPDEDLRDLFDTGETGPGPGERFHSILQEGRNYADNLNNARAVTDEGSQQRADTLRSKDYQNNKFNFDQSMKELQQLIQPVYESYRNAFGPEAMPEDPYRQKTFENAIDLSDQQKIEQAKAAGVPVWRTGGSVDEFDHVGHAVHRLSFKKGGKVRKPVKKDEGGPVPHSGRLDDLAVEPELHDQDLSSSLASLSHALSFSPDLQRLGTGIAKQFYGLDKDGHVVLGGRAWTEGQGGTPMALLDQISSAPGSVIHIGNLLKNLAEKVGSSSMGIEGPAVDKIQKMVSPDMPVPDWATNASSRLEDLDRHVAATTGVKPAQGLKQNAEDMAAMMVTPIPMSGAVKEANAARRALEFVAPVRPPLSRLPVDAGILGGVNDLVQNLTPQEHADGGQPEAPPQPEAPTEDSLLSDMLQRRMFLRQTPPPMPTNLPMAGGGEVAEGLMRLLTKLLGNSGEDTRLATRVTPKESMPQTATDPEMAAHAAEIKNRNWAANTNPGNLFGQVVSANPDMKEHAEEIARRNWSAINGNTETPTLDEGGPVEPANKNRNPMWADIRRRLAILQNPTIVGKPDPTIPAYHPSDAAQIEAQRHAQLINSLMGQSVGDESMGPIMNAMPKLDPDVLDALRAKLAGPRPSHEEAKAMENTETQRRGGPIRRSLRGRGEHQARVSRESRGSRSDGSRAT